MYKLSSDEPKSMLTCVSLMVQGKTVKTFNKTEQLKNLRILKEQQEFNRNIKATNRPPKNKALPCKTELNKCTSLRLNIKRNLMCKSITQTVNQNSNARFRTNVVSTHADSEDESQTSHKKLKEKQNGSSIITAEQISLFNSSVSNSQEKTRLDRHGSVVWYPSPIAGNNSKSSKHSKNINNAKSKDDLTSSSRDSFRSNRYNSNESLRHSNISNERRRISVEQQRIAEVARTIKSCRKKSSLAKSKEDLNSPREKKSVSFHCSVKQNDGSRFKDFVNSRIMFQAKLINLGKLNQPTNDFSDEYNLQYRLPKYPSEVSVLHKGPSHHINEKTFLDRYPENYSFSIARETIGNNDTIKHDLSDQVNLKRESAIDKKISKWSKCPRPSFPLPILLSKAERRQRDSLLLYNNKKEEHDARLSNEFKNLIYNDAPLFTQQKEFSHGNDSDTVKVLMNPSPRCVARKHLKILQKIEQNLDQINISNKKRPKIPFPTNYAMQTDILSGKKLLREFAHNNLFANKSMASSADRSVEYPMPPLRSDMNQRSGSHTKWSIFRENYWSNLGFLKNMKNNRIHIPNRMMKRSTRDSNFGVRYLGSQDKYWTDRRYRKRKTETRIKSKRYSAYSSIGKYKDCTIKKESCLKCEYKSRFTGKQTSKSSFISSRKTRLAQLRAKNNKQMKINKSNQPSFAVDINVNKDTITTNEMTKCVDRNDSKPLDPEVTTNKNEIFVDKSATEIVENETRVEKNVEVNVEVKVKSKSEKSNLSQAKEHYSDMAKLVPRVEAIKPKLKMRKATSSSGLDIKAKSQRKNKSKSVSTKHVELSTSTSSHENNFTVSDTIAICSSKPIEKETFKNNSKTGKRKHLKRKKPRVLGHEKRKNEEATDKINKKKKKVKKRRSNEQTKDTSKDGRNERKNKPVKSKGKGKKSDNNKNEDKDSDNTGASISDGILKNYLSDVVENSFEEWEEEQLLEKNDLVSQEKEKTFGKNLVLTPVRNTQPLKSDKGKNREINERSLQKFEGSKEYNSSSKKVYGPKDSRKVRKSASSPAKLLSDDSEGKTSRKVTKVKMKKNKQITVDELYQRVLRKSASCSDKQLEADKITTDGKEDVKQIMKQNLVPFLNKDKTKQSYRKKKKGAHKKEAISESKLEPEVRRFKKRKTKKSKTIITENNQLKSKIEILENAIEKIKNQIKPYLKYIENDDENKVQNFPDPVKKYDLDYESEVDRVDVVFENESSNKYLYKSFSQDQVRLVEKEQMNLLKYESSQSTDRSRKSKEQDEEAELKGEELFAIKKHKKSKKKKKMEKIYKN